MPEEKRHAVMLQMPLELIGANLAHIKLDNLQNVRKIHF